MEMDLKQFMHQRTSLHRAGNGRKVACPPKCHVPIAAGTDKYPWLPQSRLPRNECQWYPVLMKTKARCYAFFPSPVLDYVRQVVSDFFCLLFGAGYCTEQRGFRAFFFVLLKRKVLKRESMELVENSVSSLL